MKIIKERKHKIKSKRFRCGWCRSVFIADETEYRKDKYRAYLGTTYTEYSIICPVCGKRVIKVPFF